MFMEPRESYDKAIVGIMELPGSPLPMVLYDRTMVLNIMVTDMGMENSDEAEEFYQYNTLGAWVGDQTPAFATRSDADGELLKFMIEEGMVEAEIEPGLEAAVIGVYERFGSDDGIVYDKHMLTPAQRETLCCVDTTETAVLEFDNPDQTSTKKGVNP